MLLSWKLSAAKIVFLYCVIKCNCDDEFVFEAGTHGPEKFQEAKSVRYLLYDINQGEGFNLRRDVYMRVANLVKSLNEDEPWVLVLPPWGRLYHWQSRHLDQIKIPWALFFDLPSLRRYIPVIEFEEYLKITGKPVIEEVYYLQSYKEGWTNWEEKMDFRECLGNTGFVKDDDGIWHHWFFGYEEVYAIKFQCVSYMGHAGFIKPFLIHNTTARYFKVPLFVKMNTYLWLS